MCISGDRGDFVGEIDKLHGQNISGIVNQLKIEGIGEVQWSLQDTEGKTQTLRLPAYFVPKSKQRLLSTAILCHTYPDKQIQVTANCWTISDPSSAPIDIHINPMNNLLMMNCYRLPAVMNLATSFAASVSTTHKDNMNLSEPQKELIRWHNRLGHAAFKTVQFLLRTGALASTQAQKSLHTRAANLSKENVPKCAACQFGVRWRTVPKMIWCLLG